MLKVITYSAHWELDSGLSTFSILRLNQGSRLIIIFFFCSQHLSLISPSKHNIFFFNNIFTNFFCFCELYIFRSINNFRFDSKKTNWEPYIIDFKICIIGSNIVVVVNRRQLAAHPHNVRGPESTRGQKIPTTSGVLS